MRVNQVSQRVKATAQSAFPAPPTHSENGQLLALLRQANAFRLAARLEQCGQRERARRCGCGAELGAVKMFCRQYFCTACQRAKACRIAKQVAVGLSELRATYTGLKIFAGTFTLPACEADEMGKQVKKLNEGFAKLIRNPAIKRYVIGAVRVTEFTFNRQAQTFHPHLHALLVLKATYLGKGYLSQAAWLTLWQEATGCSGVTQIVIKRIQADAQRQLSAEENAAEWIRYALKPILAADWTTASLAALRRALRRRRLCEFFGAFRALRRRLRQNKLACLCLVCQASKTNQPRTAQRAAPEKKILAWHSGEPDGK